MIRTKKIQFLKHVKRNKIVVSNKTHKCETLAGSLKLKAQVRNIQMRRPKGPATNSIWHK